MKVLKGDIEQTRSKYPWDEIFDGRRRLLTAKKDFASLDGIISTIHQAATRRGVKVTTKRTKEGNLEVQLVRQAKTRKAAKKAAKKAAPKRKPAKPATKRAPRKPKAEPAAIAEAAE